MSKLSDFIGHRIPTPLVPGKVLGATGSDSVGWVDSLQQGFQEFSTSGTWSKPAGATWVYAELTGGGGGGANHSGSGDTNGGYAGGGSGGEGFHVLMRASDLPATVSVVIGAGGTGGANDSVSPGTTGGQTSFGSIAARGGNPGRPEAGRVASPAGSVAPFFSLTASLNDLQALFSPTSGTGGRSADQTTIGGGNSIWGGGGGGGGIQGAGAGVTPGGSSKFAGNGGQGNQSPNVRGGNGTAPGGGGGGSNWNGGGGDGAPGRVRVWWW